MALTNEDKKTKKSKEGGVADEIDLTSMGISDTKKVSRKTLTEGIIRPRINEIFTMVRLHLDKEGIAARIPSGAILTGGGAETVGIVDSAKRMLSLPVRVGKPKGVSGLIDDVITPAFATPVGLLLYGATGPEVNTQRSIVGKIKFPSRGIAGKLIESIRNLLP